MDKTTESMGSETVTEGTSKDVTEVQDNGPDIADVVAKAVADALAAERKAEAEKAAAEAAEKDATTDDDTELSPVEKQLAAIMAKVDQFEAKQAETLRQNELNAAAKDHQIPDEYVHIIEGKTGPELTAAAESLHKLLRASGAIKAPAGDSPQQSGLPAGKSEDELRAENVAALFPDLFPEGAK